LHRWQLVDRRANVGGQLSRQELLLR
jgi:hypothetical protein